MVRLIGKEGYLRLVRESMDKAIAGGIPRDPQFDGPTWSQALQEQLDSWGRTITGTQPIRQHDANLVKETGFSLHPEKRELTILHHMEVLASAVTTASPKPATKSAAKTLAKAHIRKHSPLDRYLGQLNLAPGKFENLSIQ